MHGEIDIQEGPLGVTLGGVEIPSIILDDHRIVFWDREPHTLEFRFDVALMPDGSFDYGQVSYHFFSPSVDLIFRYDKHPGHEDQLGTEWHQHVGQEDNRVRCDPVDLGDVLEEITNRLGWN